MRTVIDGPPNAGSVLTAICEKLVAFGPWWVGFTAANREANKDQRPQVAEPDQPPRVGETWRLRSQHDRIEVLGPSHFEEGRVVGFDLSSGGWITFDGLRTHWERVPSTPSCYPVCGVPDHAPLANMPPGPDFERVTGWQNPEDGDLHSDGAGNLYRRTADRSSPLLKELAAVINRRARENESNTPDFLLASFMSDALKAFERVTKARDCWYGIDPRPGWRDDEKAAPDQGPTAAPAAAIPSTRIILEEAVSSMATRLRTGCEHMAAGEVATLTSSIATLTSALKHDVP